MNLKARICFLEGELVRFQNAAPDSDEELSPDVVCQLDLECKNFIDSGVWTLLSCLGRSRLGHCLLKLRELCVSKSTQDYPAVICRGTLWLCFEEPTP
jgi:hypothetical protein